MSDGQVEVEELAAEQPLTQLALTKVVSRPLAAGRDTVASMITYGVLALPLLPRNPDRLARLRDDPAAAPHATEEPLRPPGTGAGLTRVARADTELADTLVAAG
ncbi:hypothetical protein [Amycolatopsis samaneae]|uniref:Uncharacterized protein n=1 Tax=Amycolatopsis samaneae TaxID=664691 RepID=A0ABW5GRI0_9PSEU